MTVLVRIVNSFSGTIVALALLVYGAMWAYQAPGNESTSRIGVVGSFASIWGIVLTYAQVLDAKRAAQHAANASDAAKAASEKTAREMRNSYYRTSLLTTRRIFAEIKAHVMSRSWKIASIRADDLSEHASFLTHARPQQDDDWNELAKSFQAWAIVFKDGTPTKRYAYNEAMWAELCLFVNDKINREYEPLSLANE